MQDKLLTVKIGQSIIPDAVVTSSTDIYQKSSAINVYQCFLGICS